MVRVASSPCSVSLQEKISVQLARKSSVWTPKDCEEISISMIQKKKKKDIETGPGQRMLPGIQCSEVLHYDEQDISLNILFLNFYAIIYIVQACLLHRQYYSMTIRKSMDLCSSQTYMQLQTFTIPTKDFPSLSFAINSCPLLGSRQLYNFVFSEYFTYKKFYSFALGCSTK